MSDQFYDHLSFGDDPGEEKTSLLSDLPTVDDDTETKALSDDSATEMLTEPFTAQPAVQREPAASYPTAMNSGSEKTTYVAPQDYSRYGASGYTNPYASYGAQPAPSVTQNPESVTGAQHFAPQTAGGRTGTPAQHFAPQTTGSRTVTGRVYGDGYTARSEGYGRTGETSPAEEASSASEKVNPYTASHAAPEKKRAKKEKSGHLSGSAIAFLLIICILVSAAAGFGGSMLATKVAKSSSGSSDVLQINRVDTESVDYSQLEDKPTTAITSEVADTVVEITTESMQTSSFYGQYIAQGAGSGVIISEDGYILTNNHVIDGASSITVTTRSGEEYTGKLIGTDSEVDIALLKIEATGLKKATFGDSSKLEVGSKAVIIGNPLGTLGGSVTEGIISALDRSIVIDGKTMHLMQTDAAINPGNSGGGMFDGQGTLSGIVVAKSSSEEIDNIGFVIPINNVLDILEDLKEYGYVRGRADTGMEFIDLTNSMFAYYYFRNTEPGVYINGVSSGSNADKAGFERGDLVVSVDGQSIKSSDEITSIISGKSAGDTVKFEISRRGTTMELSLTLAEKIPEGVQGGSTSRNDSYYSR